MIHVLNPHEYRPFQTSIALLKTIMEAFGEDFSWREPPYEYEFDRPPIDLIFGDSSIRIALEGGIGIEELLDYCAEGLDAFLELRRPYLGYNV